MKPESVSTKQERIARLARENPAMAFTSLNHYLDAEWMRYAYECTRKDGAVGVDGQTAEGYAAQSGAQSRRTDRSTQIGPLSSAAGAASLPRRSRAEDSVHSGYRPLKTR